MMPSLHAHIEQLDSDISRDFRDRNRFRALDVCIGDLPCRLLLDSEPLFAEAEKKYGAFLTTLAPAFEVFATSTKLGEQKRFAQTIESTSIDSRHYMFRWDFSVRVDLGGGVAHAQLHYDSPGSVDSILRISYALYSLPSGAALFHSASVRVNGSAVALIGGTGAGKSELSKRMDVEVFSDELTVIREREDGFWLYGTPFHGQFPKFMNDKAPVSAIIALRDEGDDRDLGAKGALTQFLMRHAFFFGDSPQTSELLLTRVLRMVERAPIRTLLLDRSLDGDKLREVIVELCQS